MEFNASLDVGGSSFDPANPRPAPTPSAEGSSRFLEGASLPSGHRAHAAPKASDQMDIESFVSETLPKMRESFQRLVNLVKETVPGWTYFPNDRYLFVEAIRIVADLERISPRAAKNGSLKIVEGAFSRAETMLSNSSRNLILGSRGLPLFELCAEKSDDPGTSNGKGLDHIPPRTLVVTESTLDQSARLLGNSLVVMSVLMRGGVRHARLLDITLACLNNERQNLHQYGPVIGTGLNIGPTLNRFLLSHAEIICANSDKLDDRVAVLLECIGLHKAHAAMCLRDIRRKISEPKGHGDSRT